jgi:threonine aldolase
MDLDRIVAAINHTDNVHNPRTGLVILENTHNIGGGTVLPQDYVTDVADQVHGRNIPVFVDGARIFHAAVASGVAVSAFAAPVDLITCCLSKALGAPVGSLIIGDAAAIEDCHRIRKPLGGAMRQAGVLAAAGLIALRDGPKHLARDHERARRLADGIAGLPGICLDPTHVETNIIMARTAQPRAAEVAAELKKEGVLIHALSGDTLRFVTHRDLDDQDVEQALAAMQKATEEVFGQS